MFTEELDNLLRQQRVFAEGCREEHLQFLRKREQKNFKLLEKYTGIHPIMCRVRFFTRRSLRLLRLILGQNYCKFGGKRHFFTFGTILRNTSCKRVTDIL